MVFTIFVDRKGAQIKEFKFLEMLRDKHTSSIAKSNGEDVVKQVESQPSSRTRTCWTP